jgi:hypothetical protein
MPTLSASLGEWNTAGFKQTLKAEIESLESTQLPLLKGISHGGVPDGGPVLVSVLKVEEQVERIDADLGVFFTEVLAGCSCGDEPMSMQGYCEMRVSIDKSSAEARFQILLD